MRLEEPAWWYESGGSLTATLLRPAAAVWGAVAVRAFERATPYRSTLPVICVGNFTAGGTGKTPLALLIGDELQQRSRQAVFLTRGYGGRIAGPHWVESERDAAVNVGDEALLLAHAAPTVVARDRVAGARMIEARRAPADVIVMDDGLQNASLTKDLTIAVVDGRRGFGNRRVVPAGPLRAPLEFQLGLAGAIVVNGPRPEEGSQNHIAEWLSQHFHGPVLSAFVQPREPTAWLEGAAVVAYAGIGAPERFFALLTRLGADVVDTVRFPDHHCFSAADAERLLGLATRASARLITTEKDWARLQGSTGVQAKLCSASSPLAVAMALADRDGGRLGALLDMAIKGQGSAAARG